MGGMCSQSKETKSTVMTYVEISKPGNREVGDDYSGIRRRCIRCITLRHQDQLALRDQEGTARRKLPLKGGIHGRPLDGG